MVKAGFSVMRTTREVNSLLCLVIGLPLNTALAHAILYRMPEEMRSYSRLLLQACVVDFYMLVSGYLLQPVREEREF